MCGTHCTRAAYGVWNSLRAGGVHSVCRIHCGYIRCGVEFTAAGRDKRLTFTRACSSGISPSSYRREQACVDADGRALDPVVGTSEAAGRRGGHGPRPTPVPRLPPCRLRQPVGRAWRRLRRRARGGYEGRAHLLVSRVVHSRCGCRLARGCGRRGALGVAGTTIFGFKRICVRCTGLIRIRIASVGLHLGSGHRMEVKRAGPAVCGLCLRELFLQLRQPSWNELILSRTGGRCRAGLASVGWAAAARAGKEEGRCCEARLPRLSARRHQRPPFLIVRQRPVPPRRDLKRVVCQVLQPGWSLTTLSCALSWPQSVTDVATRQVPCGVRSCGSCPTMFLPLKRRIPRRGRGSLEKRHGMDRQKQDRRETISDKELGRN